MSGVIDLAFGFDRNYAPHAASALASVARHARGQRFRIIMLHAGIERPLQETIESVAPGHEYVWREILDADVPQLGDRGHINRATLFRLGLEQYAPSDCTRVLYLDSDIAVLRDVRDLWAIDLEGQPIAAAIDAYLDPVKFARAWKLDGEGAYFNAGVLLIDLAKVREEKLFGRTIDLIAHQGADMPYSDQDALNAVFWRRWTRLDPAWNIQRHMVIPEGEHALSEDRKLGRERPGIVHFMGPAKPWMPGTWHPWSWAYWDNLRRTPFMREVAEEHGIDLYKRLRLRLRWLRRGPSSPPARLKTAPIRYR